MTRREPRRAPTFAEAMEAIYRIEVEDFPAFILVDDKGNDFFQQLPCMRG